MSVQHFDIEKPEYPVNGVNMSRVEVILYVNFHAVLVTYFNDTRLLTNTNNKA